MKTPPDKTIVFTLISHRTAKPKLRWVARMTFPPGADGDTMLPIEISDGEDEPVRAGTLEFAGQHLRVKDGAAELRYSDFVAGIHYVPLWLHRRGMPPVPGGLTFV